MTPARFSMLHAVHAAVMANKFCSANLAQAQALIETGISVEHIGAGSH